MKGLARGLRLILLALGLTWAAESSVPAQAQFFFPFFDNRPTKRPNTDFWGRPRDNRGGVDLRPKPKPHRDKPRSADGKKPKTPEPAKPDAAKTETANIAPAVEGPPPPYEPDLLRLSEIMGALSYFQTICGASPAGLKNGDDGPWRAQMENLMTAEGAGPSRRERLAGAYNRGLHGYEYSYHECTPNARLVQARFLDEGAKIAHEISTKYRAN